jgi:hypothetical protein
MPTDVFGRGQVCVGYQHAHEDVGMAPGTRPQECFEPLNFGNLDLFRI